MNDTILFISAYNSENRTSAKNFFKKLVYLSPFVQKEKIQSLLAKHHLSLIATNERIISIEGKEKINISYDYIKQKSFISLEPENNDTSNIENSSLIEGYKFHLNLMHTQSVLLDKRYFAINLTFWIEPFFVWINEQMYQIDASAFMMNNVLFIIFEVINSTTGKPLTKDDINGKAKNYNLFIADKYQFFNQSQPITANMKIPEIVCKIVSEFIYELPINFFLSKSNSYIHDILIFSNDIINVSDYFCKLIGIKVPFSQMKDISTVEAYKYYPQDSCSVITNFSYDNFDTILYPALILETVKLYIHVIQSANLNGEMDINQVILNDMYLQNLFCSPNFPIITYNLLNYIKESEPYKKHSEALGLKISYLRTQNELKKNRNDTVLNVLLYIISLLGAIGTLDVIEEHFGVPFKQSFIAIIILFIIGLILWIIEYTNRKNI